LMLSHHVLAGSRLQLLNNWIFDSEKSTLVGFLFGFNLYKVMIDVTAKFAVAFFVWIG